MEESIEELQNKGFFYLKVYRYESAIECFYQILMRKIKENGEESILNAKYHIYYADALITLVFNSLSNDPLNFLPINTENNKEDEFSDENIAYQNLVYAENLFKKALKSDWDLIFSINKNDEDVKFDEKDIPLLYTLSDLFSITGKFYQLKSNYIS